MNDPDRQDRNKQITAAEFERFRDLFYRKTGIFFEDGKRYFVDKRLISRMQETGFPSFRQYFMNLRFEASGEELQKLINIMTVNETYFYREAYQFQCMVDFVLTDILRMRGPEATIKIWSVPSSTGEEPYSIALYLLEQWPQLEQVDVELVSSDIDSDVLERCETGLYSARSVQNLPATVLNKYFEKKKLGSYQICEELRESVTFTQVNINDASQTSRYRNFDIVFCRNLLIYFDDHSRRQAAEVLYDALNPGGYVFLGHSESMSRISSLFKVRKFDGNLVYQRPQHAT